MLLLLWLAVNVFNPLFEDHFFIVKKKFLENSALMYELFVIKSNFILAHVGRFLSTSLKIYVFNPILTGCGHVTIIYGLIPPMAGRNRVKGNHWYHLSNSHFSKLFEVIDVLISATATDVHAADIDTAAETDEIIIRIPTKPGPMDVKILSCRSIAVGIDINRLIMISGSSCSHSSYLDIHISQNIGLCKGDFEG